MTEEYETKLEKGLKFQDYVVEKLYDIGLPIISYSSKKYQVMVGENKCGFEIKFDDCMKNTGNIYIEIAEKSNANNLNYVDSGIFRTDNTWLYIIGDYNKLFIFDKRLLKRVFNNKYYKNFNGRYVETATSKGFLIPVKYAIKILAIKIINCNFQKPLTV